MIRSRSEGPAVSLLVVLVSALSWSVPAGADDRAAARRFFVLGERAFAEQQWEEALEQYSSAYEAAALPGFLFNIGQCHRKLENWEAAADFFRRYLEALPDAPNRSDAVDLLEEVEGHLQAPEPETALEPPPEPARPPPGAPAAEVPSTAGPTIGLATWIVLGAGVVQSVVAVAFALDLSGAQSSFDDPSLDCARRPDRCRSLRDRGETAATARTVFAAGAVAALATGGILLVLDLRSPPAERRDAGRSTTRLSLGPGRLSLEGTW